MSAGKKRPGSKFEQLALPRLGEIAAWVAMGADEKEIAGKLGVGYSTLRQWLSRGRKGQEPYKQLADAFLPAQDGANEQVMAALFRKANGYNAPVTKHYKLRKTEYDPDTGRKVAEREELVEVKETVHIPADTQAQMFWLANKAPKDWAYRPKDERTGENEDNGTGVIEMAPVAPEPEEPGESRDAAGAALNSQRSGELRRGGFADSEQHDGGVPSGPWPDGE